MVASPFPALVADIGGTNARFALVHKAGDLPTQVQTLPVAQYPNIADAVRAYVSDHSLVIKTAALAVATPVQGDVIAFTNSPWHFSRAQLRSELGLERLLVLNDFEALALSLPRLAAGQCEALRGTPTLDGTLAVVGPGTGLGVGGVMRAAGQWHAISGEGGHATIAPHDAFEAQLLAYLHKTWPHVSGERLLSGIGLPTLYEGVAAVLGVPVQSLKGREIVTAGLARSDAVADRTLDQFCAMLGGFCGSVVLTMGAWNGLFLGGGIVPRLGARFSESAFLARFEAKGRFQARLSAVPIAIITDTLAALSGSGLAVEQSAC